MNWYKIAAEPITPEQTNAIITLYKQKAPQAEIARALGLNWKTVVRTLQRNGVFVKTKISDPVRAKEHGEYLRQKNRNPLSDKVMELVRQGLNGRQIEEITGLDERTVGRIITRETGQNIKSFRPEWRHPLSDKVMELAKQGLDSKRIEEITGLDSKTVLKIVVKETGNSIKFLRPSWKENAGKEKSPNTQLDDMMTKRWDLFDDAGNLSA
jgi:transposase-like protein